MEGSNSWEEYYKKVNIKPREVLVKALKLFKSDNCKRDKYFAVDLGCGNGPDTIELLRSNWEVLAVDVDPTAFKFMKEFVPEKYKMRLKCRCESFEKLSIIPRTTLVNASYSLPFCNPNSFCELWNNVSLAIEKGGRFSGNFFGIRDEWIWDETMNFHTRQEIEEMFKGFELEYINEWEKDKQTVSGVSKHWHVFDVVARKR